jgi:polysaccharide export outer membrane protein
MKRTGAIISSFLAALSLSGCQTAGPSPLPVGADAYKAVPEHVVSSVEAEAIGPGDHLAIKVFGEPELSGEDYFVDSKGFVQFPLLGEVIVAGQTPREFALNLQRRLSARYVRDASVTVTVLDRPQSTFTVEGEVNVPGVYPATASSTLLAAMAIAKSPTRTAKTDDILVFRNISGQRAGGRFNLNDIRRGRAADPQILAGDTIIVVSSATKSAWRDLLQALPLLNTFTLLRN